MRRANAEARLHVVLAVAVGLSLAVIVVLQARLLGWRDGQQITTLAVLHGAGGLLGVGAGSWLAAALPWRGPRRGAAWLVLAGGGGMGLAVLLFALTYRAAYVQWHDEPFTLRWLFQGVFTMAGALYYWAVLGTRMVLPWALVPFVLGALAFARAKR